jgi:hypothetical protein
MIMKYCWRIARQHLHNGDVTVYSSMFNQIRNYNYFFCYLALLSFPEVHE